MKREQSEPTLVLKHEPVRAKILPPLIVAICLLEAIFLGIFWHHHREDMVAIEVSTAQRVQDLLQAEMEQNVARMDTAMEALVRNAELTNALADLNSDRLISETKPLFEQLRTRHDITHFYFHRPDRVNLLRLHKDTNGDLINRITIQTAEQTGKPSAGLEQGPTGNPVLRLVYPWRSDFSDTPVADLFANSNSGELLGYLELGIELEDIAQHIHTLLDIDLILAVDKAYLDAQQWTERNQKLGRQSNWDDFQDHVIVDKTIDTIPTQVTEAIANFNTEVNQVFTQNGQNYQVISFPFHDINGREIGYVIALKDVSEDIEHARQVIFLTLTLTVGVGVGLSTLFYLFLGKIERNLNDGTLKLALATDALADSKAQLEEYSHTLEKKVKARTYELQEKNQTLEQALQELQTAQTQLIQTEKMSSLGQLVAGVAHEINNPVNFIHGNLSHVQEYTQDLLNLVHLHQRYYPNPATEIQTEMDEIDLEFLQDDLPKVLDSMKVGTDRIRQIVLSLRNFSRTDEAEFKAVDIHEGINSTILILQHRLRKKSDHPAIQLIRDYGELPLVECYPGQLNQVFMNILANAIDALEDAGEQHTHQDNQEHSSQITIRTSAIDSQWIQIAIADNGTGMPKEVLQHIFDPFFTTKPVGRGTGMGMSISYHIITEKHCGKLECFSTQGEGTEFIIQIPVQQSQRST